jgi:hypothetical protein
MEPLFCYQFYFRRQKKLSQVDQITPPQTFPFPSSILITTFSPWLLMLSAEEVEIYIDVISFYCQNYHQGSSAFSDWAKLTGCYHYKS